MQIRIVSLADAMQKGSFGDDCGEFGQILNNLSDALRRFFPNALVEVPTLRFGDISKVLDELLTFEISSRSSRRPGDWLLVGQPFELGADSIRIGIAALRGRQGQLSNPAVLFSCS